jgi:hypothetical protein
MWRFKPYAFINLEHFLVGSFALEDWVSLSILRQYEELPTGQGRLFALNPGISPLKYPGGSGQWPGRGSKMLS